MWNQLQFPRDLVLPLLRDLDNFLFPSGPAFILSSEHTQRHSEGRLYHQLSKQGGCLHAQTQRKVYNRRATGFEGNADSFSTFPPVIKHVSAAKIKALPPYLGKRNTYAVSCPFQRYVCTKGMISGC